MAPTKRCLVLSVVCLLLAAAAAARAQSWPALTWITNSSIKLEQIIGDVDWEAAYFGTNLTTASQTVTQFHILGTGHGYSFEDQGKLIFLFGDTISEDTTNWNYHGHDPFAWSTNTDGVFIYNADTHPETGGLPPARFYRLRSN